MNKIKFTNLTNISNLQNPSNNPSLFFEFPNFNDFDLYKQYSIIQNKIKHYHPSIKFTITISKNEIEIIAKN